jgi:hypothetical protein
VPITHPFNVEPSAYWTVSGLKFTWLKKSVPVVNVPSSFSLRPKAMTLRAPVAPGPVALPAPSTSKAKLGVRPLRSPSPSKPSERLGPFAKLAKAMTVTV